VQIRGVSGFGGSGSPRWIEFPGYNQRSDEEMDSIRRFLGYNRVRNGVCNRPFEGGQNVQYWGGCCTIGGVILIFGKYIPEQILKKDWRFSHVRSQGDSGECQRFVV